MIETELNFVEENNIQKKIKHFDEDRKQMLLTFIATFLTFSFEFLLLLI